MSEFDTQLAALTGANSSLQTAIGKMNSLMTASETADVTIEGQAKPSVAKQIKLKIDPLLAAASTQISDEVDGLADRFGFATTSKNLVNPAEIQAGKYFSPGSNAVVNNPVYRCTGYIPVVSGQYYAASGLNIAGGGGVIGGFASVGGGGLGSIASVAISGGLKFVVPTGVNFVVINITNNSSLAYDSTVQVEAGKVITPYTAYDPTLRISNDRVIGLGSMMLTSKYTEYAPYKNLLDPAKIDYTKRYSTGAKAFQTDGMGIAASGYIPVNEGEWYVVSGGGLYGQGGYFVSDSALTAIQNIVFVTPVDGVGMAFQIPLGLGITHVVMSLRKLNDLAASTSLHGNVQLETGEQATAFEPYAIAEQIKPQYVRIPSTQAAGIDKASLYTDLTVQGNTAWQDKIPSFRHHWMLRDKDLTVVNTGTSLSARSVEHCTRHPDETTRPPLMHSNNFATHIWDAIAWDNQHYRRYDAVGFFTESGTFATAGNLTGWDDGPYRDGLTRYSGGAGAYVEWQFPANAWQANFIYRTDSVSTEQATVTVSEGSGLMQVYDGTGWVEANGYNFTMRETAPVTRSVAVPNPATGGTTLRALASKGNTTYQKRLKMRAVTRTSVKTVRVTATTAGRLGYWGVEWSLREFMITYINAARGSHKTNAEGAASLPRYQDNEVWSFKPDLMLFELGIHNDGASGANSYPADQWAGLAESYAFDPSYELSLVGSAARLGLPPPEIAMYHGTITWNFGGIADDGVLIASAQMGGKMITAFDKYAEAHQHVVANHPTALSMLTTRDWIEAGNAIFGDLKSATIGSGKGGATFTNEGSHWNDTGSKIMARAVLPLLRF